MELTMKYRLLRYGFCLVLLFFAAYSVSAQIPDNAQEILQEWISGIETRQDEGFKVAAGDFEYTCLSLSLDEFLVMEATAEKDDVLRRIILSEPMSFQDFSSKMRVIEQRIFVIDELISGEINPRFFKVVLSPELDLVDIILKDNTGFIVLFDNTSIDITFALNTSQMEPGEAAIVEKKITFRVKDSIVEHGLSIDGFYNPKQEFLRYSNLENLMLSVRSIIEQGMWKARRVIPMFEEW